jgi:hypothetical protein
VSIVAQIEPPLDLLRFTLAVDGILGLLATGDFASLDALHPTPRLSGADVQRIVAAAGIRLGPAPRPTWPHYRVDVPADGTVVVENPDLGRAQSANRVADDDADLVFVYRAEPEVSTCSS